MRIISAQNLKVGDKVALPPARWHKDRTFAGQMFAYRLAYPDTVEEVTYYDEQWTVTVRDADGAEWSFPLYASEMVYVVSRTAPPAGFDTDEDFVTGDFSRCPVLDSDVPNLTPPATGWHDLSPMVVSESAALLSALEGTDPRSDRGSIWCDGDEMTILSNGGIHALDERYGIK